MKPVFLLGIFALVGAMFLALGAPSVSARTSDATPAETDVNATPHGAPPPVTALNTTGPVILPTPSPSNDWIAVHPNLGEARVSGSPLAQTSPRLGNAPVSGNFEVPPPPVLVPHVSVNSSVAPGTGYILPVPENDLA